MTGPLGSSRRVEIARHEFQRATYAAVDQLVDRYKTYSELADRAGLSVGVVRKLRSDGDASGWRPPSRETCLALDRLTAAGSSPTRLDRLRQEYVAAREEAKTLVEDGRTPVPRVRIGNPPLPAIGLRRRQELLDRLLTASRTGGAVVTSLAVGNGGVGKTQLARSAWDAGETDRTQVMVWVTASSRSAIVATLAFAAAQVGASTSRALPDLQAAEAFVAWLATTRLTWLVVFDGLQDRRDIEGLCPAGAVDGRVVVTSRIRTLRLPEMAFVDVGVFAPAEAEAYLLERIMNDPEARTDAADGADALAEAVGYLPLALAQAASYVVRTGRSCAEYVTLFHDRRSTVATLFPEVDLTDDYQFTVATTWSLAIDAANALEPVGLARPALELASVLGAAPIPETVWTGLTGRTHIPARQVVFRLESGTDFTDVLQARSTLRRREVTQEEARDALRNLHRFSVISHDPGSAGRPGSVTVHALVQRAAREALDDDGIVVFAAGTALNEIWSHTGPDADLVDHVRMLDQQSAQWGDDHDVLVAHGVHPVLSGAANTLRLLGQLTAAREFLSQVRTRAERILGPDHADVISLRRLQAVALGESGDVVTAEGDLTAVLEAERRLYAENSHAVHSSRVNLALVSAASGRVDHALAELSAVRDEQTRVLGERAAVTLMTRANIGFVLSEANRTDEAIPVLQAVLADQALGGIDLESEEVLQVRNNLAMAWCRAGHHDAALDELERLLELRLRVSGERHPKTLAVQNNRGYCLGQAGRFQEALAEHEAVLAKQTRHLDPTYVETDLTRLNIAVCKEKLGHVTEAREIVEAVVAGHRERSSVLQPHMVGALDLLARLRAATRDFRGAVEAEGEWFASQTPRHGPASSLLWTARYNVAVWCYQAGEVQQGIDVLGRLIDDVTAAVGGVDPRNRTFRRTRAVMLSNSNQHAAALEEFESLRGDAAGVLRVGDPELAELDSSMAAARRRADHRLS